MGRPSAACSSPGTLSGRLGPALAGSVILHLAGAWTLAPDILPGRTRESRESIPITVRLERAPAAAVATPQVRPQPRTAPEPLSRASNPAPARQCCPRLLSAPADATVYTAGELDSLPVPVAPLATSRLSELASTTLLRLELTIDEHGAVHSVSIAGPRLETGAENELRLAIAATAFVPARKDGRAVKSRIVLGVQ
jgi:hypothetical protein